MSTTEAQADQRTEIDKAQFAEGLRGTVGASSDASAARDPVNQPMIRHWCDAMEDHNPVYTDSEAAAGSLHGGIVAPPAMLNAWGMWGLGAPTRASAPRAQSSPLAALDEAGFTSVVATNSEHTYGRYLRLGDVISGTQTLEDVSDEKQTALGVGHFVTTRTRYTDQDDNEVGSLLFRILKYRPGTGRQPAGGDGDSERPPRPRPGINRDTAFFWEGVDKGELRIQRCTGCGRLGHPPYARCPDCGSYDFDYAVSVGRGTVYSFVQPRYPLVPSFEYPYIVGLVELEEGTRLVTNIVDVSPGSVRVGMPVEVDFRQVDPELTLPLFRPMRPDRRETTLRFDEVDVGTHLPPCPIPITTTLIVAGAIASRDYQDVHHDRDLAIERGSPDIVMNILTTSGLCGRYLSDWAGPEAMFANLSIRLGVPNYPGETMRMTGKVTDATPAEGGGGIVRVSFGGSNRLGNHVTGTADLMLPAGS